MSAVAGIVEKYQAILLEKLRQNEGFEFSRTRPTMGKTGIPCRTFIFHLLNQKQIFMDFLKETGLVKSSLNCDKCGGKMTLRMKKGISENAVWACRCVIEGKACEAQKSLRHESMFFGSKLKMQEILLLVFELIDGTSEADIQRNYFFSDRTMSAFRHYIHQIILDYVMSYSEKIGGVGKIIEVGESKFGKRKSTIKHPLDEQQVLGGIEQGSGKFFLVVVDDKSAKTMKEIIEEWVEPGTQIHSDSWKARDSLGEKWYQHLTVNHNVNFMGSDSSIRSNTFESSLKHVKSSLPAFSLKNDYHFYFAVLIFKTSCKEENVNYFNKFVEVVRDIKWESLKISIE